MQTICQYAGYNSTHAYFLDKNETKEFQDTTFVDIPRKDWDELGRPLTISVTVEVAVVAR